MTSDEIKKVREAAESSSYLPSACIMDYVPIMRNFALSLVGTDGEQPITDEWLREEWKKLGGEIDLHSGREKYVHPHLEGWLEIQRGQVFYYADEHVEVVQLVTRYQFRLLAAALGIKRKGE